MNFFKLTCQSAFKNVSIVKIITSSQSRSFQTSQSILLSQGGGKSQVKGSSEIIRLYDQNGKVIGNKSKHEADIIAKKNGFTLVAMEILGKPKFPEYQLKPRYYETYSTGDDLEKDHESDNTRESAVKKVDKEGKKTTKEIKRITFETSIASADLKVKIDQINNWITKGKEVHAIIVGSHDVPMETFSAQIFDMLTKDARFLSNKLKGHNLRLIMDKKPTKDSIDSADSTEDLDKSSSSNSESSAKFKNDEFVIDPDLLSNDAELEKILKNKKFK